MCEMYTILAEAVVDDRDQHPAKPSIQIFVFITPTTHNICLYY